MGFSIVGWRTRTSGGAGTTSGSGAIRYVPWVGGDGVVSTKPSAQQKINYACTLKKFSVYVKTNTRTTTTTVRPQINSSNGNSVCSVTASTTGWFQDASNTDSLSAGDNLLWAITNGVSSESSPLYTVIHALLDSGTGTAATTVYGQAGNTGYNWGGRATDYGALAGAPFTSWSSGETVVQAKFRAAGTISRPQIYISSSNTASALTGLIRKNGADQSPSVSVTAATTGWFQDTTNSVSVSSGDLVNWIFKNNGNASGTATTLTNAVCFQSSDESVDIITAPVGGSTSTRNASTQTQYFAILGALVYPGSTTEADMEVKPGLDCRLSRLRIYVNSNSGVGSTLVFTLRKNQADTACTASAAAGTTGWIEDTTNTIGYSAGDTACHKVSSSVSNTSNLGSVMVLMQAGLGAQSGQATIATTYAVSASTIRVKAATPDAIATSWGVSATASKEHFVAASATITTTWTGTASFTRIRPASATIASSFAISGLSGSTRAASATIATSWTVSAPPAKAARATIATTFGTSISAGVVKLAYQTAIFQTELTCPATKLGGRTATLAASFGVSADAQKTAIPASATIGIQFAVTPGAVGKILYRTASIAIQFVKTPTVAYRPKARTGRITTTFVTKTIEPTGAIRPRTTLKTTRGISVNFTARATGAKTAAVKSRSSTQAVTFTTAATGKGLRQRSATPAITFGVSASVTARKGAAATIPVQVGLSSDRTRYGNAAATLPVFFDLRSDRVRERPAVASISVQFASVGTWNRNKAVSSTITTNWQFICDSPSVIRQRSAQIDTLFGSPAYPPVAAAFRIRSSTMAAQFGIDPVPYTRSRPPRSADIATQFGLAADAYGLRGRDIVVPTQFGLSATVENRTRSAGATIAITVAFARAAARNPAKRNQPALLSGI